MKRYKNEYIDKEDWNRLSKMQQRRIIRLGRTSWYYKTNTIDKSENGFFISVSPKNLKKETKLFSELINYIDIIC